MMPMMTFHLLDKRPEAEQKRAMGKSDQNLNQAASYQTTWGLGGVILTQAGFEGTMLLTTICYFNGCAQILADCKSA
jgi:hypothetical protein